MTKKSPQQLGREIDAALGHSDWVQAKVRAGWPETWERLMDGWWYMLERRPGGGWFMGFSRRRGDADSIDRGSWFPSRGAAMKFSETHARI